jgi:glycerol dehydrogenase
MKQRHLKKGLHAQACGSFSFPGKIIRGEGAAGLAVSEAKGKTVLLSDNYVLRQFGPKIKNKTEMEHIVFPGGCSPGNFFRIKTVLLEKGIGTLVAAGGGKALDLAKYLKREIPGLFLINIPTSAATCAAVTPVTVLYDEKGVYMDTLDTLSPDVLIMDYEIFYDLPMPFFAAGAIDALAKYYEAAVYCENTKKPNPYDLFMLQTIKRSYMRLKKLIIEKWMKPDPALKRELADILITESGQLSCMGRYTVTAGLAHAIAHSVTASAGAREFIHGEHVSAGLVLQEQYLKNAERLSEIESLSAVMDLPVSFLALGIRKQELPALEKLYNAIIFREKIFVPKMDEIVYNIIGSQY